MTANQKRSSRICPNAGKNAECRRCVSKNQLNNGMPPIVMPAAHQMPPVVEPPVVAPPGTEITPALEPSMVQLCFS